MTDKDMAFDLGNRIITQQQRIVALESFITQYCMSDPNRHTIDWRTVVRQNQAEEALQKTAAAWLRGLRVAIDAEIQDSSLIRVLHTEFQNDNSRNILERDWRPHHHLSPGDNYPPPGEGIFPGGYGSVFSSPVEWLTADCMGESVHFEVRLSTFCAYRFPLQRLGFSEA